ncbi:unnamed protein product [Arabis nemorensis]|uniref:Uncharacterized protein n=1 Tax=Arabis nemorensis TaxID=586526 RepID=A0A565C9W5_9BRAS|nr:unnamed protein product [Arabis nemorensis]
MTEFQDREIGDGTTSVVIVAAEMLKEQNTSNIICSDLHCRSDSRIEKLVTKVENLGKVPLIYCAKTSKAIDILKAHGQSARDS